MRSPAAAFRWEFGARHQWVLIALGIYLLALGMIKPLVLGPGAKVRFGDGFIGFGLVPFSFAFFYFIAVFSFGLNGDLAGRASIFPSRLFTLPVKTAELARWPMVYGGAAMMLLWFGTAILARWPLGLELPLVWPALLGAVVMAWTQALTWMPYGLRGIRVIAATLVLISIDATVITAIELELPETTLIAFLAPQLPLAYAIACYGVARARRGVVPDWSLFSGGRAIGARPLSPFQSPAAAQFWFEWRRNGRSLPILVAMVLPFELLMLFVGGFGSTGFIFEVLLFVLVTPIVMAGFTAATVSKANPFARDAYGVSPFTATKPITTVGLIAAKLKMAMWSTFAAWILVLLFIPIGFSWSGADSVLIEWARWFAIDVGMPRAIVFGILVLGGFMLGTWMMLVQSMFVGLSGRVWLIKTSGIAGLVFFMAIGPIFQLVVESRAALAWLWDNWVIVPAILVVLKIIAAIVIAGRLSRRGLISERALVIGAASWAALVFVLYGALVWWVDTPLLPRYGFMLIAILAVPLARISAAPLALASNRHR